jgi:UbiA prenyltransferase family protein
MPSPFTGTLPVFLWGYLLGLGRVDGRLLVSYSAFHLFGYAGGTALNSFYDRDEGPIGGQANPPPVPPGLLAFSLAWQALGFILALTVGLPFAGIYATMFCLSLAYSHPAFRWKGKPLLAIATVALGQGVLAFLGGWSAARGEILTAFALFPVLGAATATLMIVGFYPLTESYQLEADADRGDLTVARFMGITRSFRFAELYLLTGGVLAALVAATRFSNIEAVFLTLFVGLVLVSIERWHRRFARHSILENYRTTMRLYAALTLPLMAWIVFHLFIQ